MRNTAARARLLPLFLLSLSLACCACASPGRNIAERDTGFQHEQPAAEVVGGQQRRAPQLLPQSQPGAEIDSSKKLVMLEKIGKLPGDPVSLPDVHAANKWLCEAAGGSLDDDYNCDKKRVFKFASKEMLHDLRAHRDAIRSVFRAPGVRSVAGPRGEVQLVYMGLPFVEWGEEGSEWNRQASATQTYLKAHRPQPAHEVPLHFLRGSELLQIERSSCHNCYYSVRRLADDSSCSRSCSTSGTRTAAAAAPRSASAHMCSSSMTGKLTPTMRYWSCLPRECGASHWARSRQR